MSWTATETNLACEQLRNSVMDLIQSYPQMDDNLYLLRFLASRKMNPAEAEKLLRVVTRWRVAKKMDELMEQEPNPELVQEFPIHDSCLKNGAPVVMLEMKNLDLKGLINKYGIEEMYIHCMRHASLEERRNIRWTRERYKVALSKDSNFEILPDFLHGNTLLVDFKDVSLSQLASFKCVTLCRRLITDYMHHFPIFDATCLVINCSKLARPFVNLMWNLVKKPGFTVEVYDTEESVWKEAMLKRARPDQLLESFGGILKS